LVVLFSSKKRKGFITFLDTEGLAPCRHQVEVMAKLEEPAWFVGSFYFMKE